MKLVATCILGAALVCAARAGTELRWDVETARPAQFNTEFFQGETVTLAPRFLDYGAPRAFASNDWAMLYFQTNGMGSNWWTNAVTTISLSDTGRVAAVWSPDLDVGAARYRFFIAAVQSNAITYRAFGNLTMRASPGFTPGIQEPVSVPWATYAFAASALARAEEAAALGSNAQATADAAVTAGSNAQVTADGAYSAGTNAQAAAAAAAALGSNAQVTADGAYSAGTNAQAAADTWLSVSNLLLVHVQSLHGLTADGGFYGGSIDPLNLPYIRTGGAIGNNAFADEGGAVGDTAWSAEGGFAGGSNSIAYNGGVAVGRNSFTAGGVAVGRGAATHMLFVPGTGIDAIQLGTGSNVVPRSLQVYDFPLLDPSGNIYPARYGSTVATGLVVSGQTGTMEDGVLTIDLAATEEVDPFVVRSATWRNPEWFDLAWARNPTSAPDVVTYSTNLDIIVERQGFNLVKTDRIAQIGQQHGYYDLTFSVEPAALATVSSNGYLTHLADGTVTAVVTAATFARTNVLALATSGGALDRWWGAAAGSMRAAAIAAVETGVTGGTMSIWTTYEPAATNFVRATNQWLRPAPECTPAWNSRGGYVGGGALITPRHLVVAEHSSSRPQPGDTVWFVDATNAVHVAVATGQVVVASDLMLVRLDRDVAVSRAKFIADPADYLPNGVRDLPLACGEIHGGEHRMQLVLGGSAAWNVRGARGISWWKAPDKPAWRDLFYHWPASGDSGQPVFLTVGDELVLLFCQYYPATGPCAHTYLPEIRAAIAAWGDTNDVEYVSTPYTEF